MAMEFTSVVGHHQLPLLHVQHLTLHMHLTKKQLDTLHFTQTQMQLLSLMPHTHYIIYLLDCYQHHSLLLLM
jgi:hypothetical protein